MRDPWGAEISVCLEEIDTWKFITALISFLHQGCATVRVDIIGYTSTVSDEVTKNIHLQYNTNKVLKKDNVRLLDKDGIP